MLQFDANTSKFDGIVNFFQDELKNLRTGRATPSLVESIIVEAYQSRMPMVQVASISAPDPKTIVIQPWDSSLLKAIEKAIQLSDVHISPVIDKDIVRLSLPQLTEENRREQVKILNQKAEASRVKLRQLRDKLKHDIQGAEKLGEISEDEKFKFQKKLDELVKEYSDKIVEIVDKKETEIMTM